MDAPEKLLFWRHGSQICGTGGEFVMLEKYAALTVGGLFLTFTMGFAWDTVKPFAISLVMLAILLLCLAVKAWTHTP